MKRPQIFGYHTQNGEGVWLYKTPKSFISEKRWHCICEVWSVKHHRSKIFVGKQWKTYQFQTQIPIPTMSLSSSPSVRSLLRPRKKPSSTWIATTTISLPPFQPSSTTTTSTTTTTTATTPVPTLLSTTTPTTSFRTQPSLLPILTRRLDLGRLLLRRLGGRMNFDRGGLLVRLRRRNPLEAVREEFVHFLIWDSPRAILLILILMKPRSIILEARKGIITVLILSLQSLISLISFWVSDFVGFF